MERDALREVRGVDRDRTTTAAAARLDEHRDVLTTWAMKNVRESSRSPTRSTSHAWDAMSEEEHQALGHAGIKRVLDIARKNGATPPGPARRPSAVAAAYQQVRRDRERPRPDLAVSVQAEQALLGALLLDSAALAKIATIIGWTDFHSEEHQTIYRHIAELVGRRQTGGHRDLAQNLENVGKLDAAGGGGVSRCARPEHAERPQHPPLCRVGARPSAAARTRQTVGRELQESAVRPGADLDALKRDTLARMERLRPVRSAPRHLHGTRSMAARRRSASGRSGSGSAWATRRCSSAQRARERRCSASNWRAPSPSGETSSPRPQRRAAS